MNMQTSPDENGTRVKYYVDVAAINNGAPSKYTRRLLDSQ